LILQIRNETGPLVAFHLRKGAFVLLFCFYFGMHCDDDVRRARKAPSKLAQTHLSFPRQFCSIIHKYLTTYLSSITAHVDAPSYACINKCFAATPSILRKKKLLSRSWATQETFHIFRQVIPPSFLTLPSTTAGCRDRSQYQQAPLGRSQYPP